MQTREADSTVLKMIYPKQAKGRSRAGFVIRSESGRYRTAGMLGVMQAEWSESAKTRKQN